jgi:hypothetical protein
MEVNMKTLVKKDKKQGTRAGKKALCCAKLSNNAVGCHD